MMNYPRFSWGIHLSGLFYFYLSRGIVVFSTDCCLILGERVAEAAAN